MWVPTARSGRRACIAAIAVALALGFAAPAHAEPRERTTVAALLNSLPVSPESNAGYERDQFRHWITTDGCTTREWVLIRQALTGTRSGCVVINGRWFSRYDGEVTEAATTFDIDHMVPLAEAWGSGASTWTAERRRDYANDLVYRPALIAVTASSNRSKGDRDPAEWLPPVRTYWCKYLRQWVAVKYRWSLAVDAAEKEAIVVGLVGCRPRIDTPPKA